MLFPSLQVRLAGLLICLVVGIGCRMPWQPKNDVPTIQARSEPAHQGQTTQVHDSPVNQRTANRSISNEDSVLASDVPSAPEPTEDEAMAGLLDELQAIHDIDPDAHQILMRELRDAKPAHWPLIVHQFHAALTYHQQLANREMDRHRLARNTDEQPVSAESLDHRPSPLSTPEPPNRENGTSVQQLANRSAPIPRVHDDSNPEISIPRSLPSNSLAPTGTPSPPDRAPAENQLFDNPLRAGVVPEPREMMANDELQDSHPQLGSEPSIVQSAGFQTATTPPRLTDPFDIPTASPAIIACKDSTQHPASWEAQLETTIEQLEAATTDAPDTADEIRRHALLRMLYMIADRREDALRPIPGILPTQQDYWGKQLFALATYLDDQGHPDAQSRATIAQSQLAEATVLLGELGALSVRNLTFCEHVSGFGTYTAIEKPQFSPEERVTLYAEIENYRSDMTEAGYRTVLEASYRVLDDRGQRVDSGMFPQIEDVCQSRRRDFHTQYGIKLPQRIYPGKYTLQLIVQDMLSNKIGRASTEFEIKDGR